MPFAHSKNWIKRKSQVSYLCWLPGGLSQYETFNVEFNKDVLAKSTPIKTNADGIRKSLHAKYGKADG